MMRVMHSILIRSAGLCRLAAMLLVMALPAGSLAAQPEPLQRSFSSADEARQALIAAVQAKDHDALRAIFGPAARDLEPGDPVEQAAEFDHFARHLLEAAELVKEGDAKAVLVIGAEKWPFPVPIV